MWRAQRRAEDSGAQRQNWRAWTRRDASGGGNEAVMTEMRNFMRRLILGVLVAACIEPKVLAQEWVKDNKYFVKGGLPGDFERVREVLGQHMTTPANATLRMEGQLTDSSGTRGATITVQAPGYLLLAESNSRTIGYDGDKWKITNGKGPQADAQAQESLLAHLPESFLLQLANNGTVRRIGAHFRTDNGKTPNYTGPYWTIYSFTPSARNGLAHGQALQQGYLVAIDEKTGFLAEVRVIVKTNPNLPPSVTQTKYNKWNTQNGHSYPTEIVRIENGQQTLKFAVQTAQTGPEANIGTFRP